VWLACMKEGGICGVVNVEECGGMCCIDGYGG
jgi:hypothetical protein